MKKIIRIISYTALVIFSVFVVRFLIQDYLFGYQDLNKSDIKEDSLISGEYHFVEAYGNRNKEQCVMYQNGEDFILKMNFSSCELDALENISVKEGFFKLKEELVFYNDIYFGSLSPIFIRIEGGDCITEFFKEIHIENKDKLEIYSQSRNQIYFKYEGGMYGVGSGRKPKILFNSSIKKLYVRLLLHKDSVIVITSSSPLGHI